MAPKHKKIIVSIGDKRIVQEARILQEIVSSRDNKKIIREVTQGTGSYKGEFSGKFYGDGSKITKLDWHALPGKIPGSKVSRGGGAVSVDHVRFSDSSSFTSGSVTGSLRGSVTGSMSGSFTGSVSITGPLSSSQNTYLSGTIVIDGAVQRPIKTVTSDYQVETKDWTLLADASGGQVGVTMPASPLQGQFFVVKRINLGGQNVVVSASAGQTIDGDATKTILYQYSAIQLQYSASNWYII